MRITPRRAVSTLVTLLVCVLLSVSALAQQGGGGPGGPGGGPPRFDPAQFRQMMLDRLRDQLKASDDEWQVLQPKIEKVMQAQQNSQGGGMGMMFGRGPGGPGGPGGGNDNPSPVAKASRDLRDAVQEGSNVDKAELAKRMAAFREARDKARQELADAQKALLEVLTPQQEAVLLAFGMVQ